MIVSLEQTHLPTYYMRFNDNYIHAHHRQMFHVESDLLLPSEPIGTVGDKTNGEPCVFPFTYESKVFYTCTTFDAKDEEVWCATTTEYSGKWGYCTYGKQLFSVSEASCTAKLKKYLLFLIQYLKQQQLRFLSYYHIIGGDTSEMTLTI